MGENVEVDRVRGLINRAFDQVIHEEGACDEPVEEWIPHYTKMLFYINRLDSIVVALANEADVKSRVFVLEIMLLKR